MRFLLLNARFGKVERTVGEDGRTYLVAPLVSIPADGVLPGSQGALRYPVEETCGVANNWDGIPLVENHPQDALGHHVSADDVPETHLGHLRDSRCEQGTLKHKAWFDEAWTKDRAPEVYNALVRGEPMEISTGLYTTNRPVGSYSTNKHGRPYVADATDHRPDHMAVLPHQIGACSIDDGCGLMVNANPEGHNQWSKAIKAAKDASDSAVEASKSAKSVEEHAGARLKHIAAAKASLAADDTKAAQTHIDMADNHTKEMTKKEPEPKPKRTRNMRLTDDQRRLIWNKLSEAMFAQNASQGRHSQTQRFEHHAATQAMEGFKSLAGGDDEPRGMGRNLPGDDGRDTMKGHREFVDLDGDGDGPVDDDAWRKEDEEAERTEEPPPQYGNRKGRVLSNKSGGAGGGAGAGSQGGASHTEVRSPTSTSTKAKTFGNITVTGGAGRSSPTTVHVHLPGTSADDDTGDDDDSEEPTINSLERWIVYNRDWPQTKRDKLDEKDFAGPDQSFPIATQEDLDAAVHSVGRAKNPSSVKAGIKRIAKRKGLTLPESMAENEMAYGDAGKATYLAKEESERTANPIAKMYARKAWYVDPNDAHAHDDCAELHKMAAKVHENEGDFEAARMHDEARKAHLAGKSMTKNWDKEKPSGIKPPKVGSAQAQADTTAYKRAMTINDECPECGGEMKDGKCECGYVGNANLNEAVKSVTTNKSECPKCGGKMGDDGMCEECGYEVTENAFGSASAPEGGGMVLGQPRAHAATVQAAAASMDHPPARAAAIKAFDHSKGGKSNHAATQHSNAADAHDDAAKEAYSDGEDADGDQHASAAMLHRKAAAMHSIDKTNMVGNAHANQYTKGNNGKVTEALGGKSVPGREDIAAIPHTRSSAHEAMTGMGYKKTDAGYKSGSGESIEYEHPDTGHKTVLSFPKGKNATGFHAPYSGGTNNMRRSIKAMNRSQVVNALRRHLCPKEQKVMNDLNTETLKQVLNAKVQGSNADAVGSGDFDDAEIAGGWDDTKDGDGYKNRQLVESDDTEEDVEDEPTKTGGKDANDEVRGRKGVSNSLTENQWLAMAPPAAREQYLQGKQRLHQQKVSIIRQLVGHLPKQRQDRIVANQKLLSKTVPQLEEMLLLQGPTANFYTEDPLRSPMYLGSGDVPTINEAAPVNSSDANDIACLVPQTLNFKAIAEEEAQVRNGRSHGVNYANGERSSVATSAEAAM